jgi:GNAT superfamily N-acetyltransferase
MELWCRVVEAGFQGQDELGSAEAAASGFSAEAEGNRFFLATVDEVPAGAAVLGCFGGIGVFSGTSVLPRFRGHGLQRELLRARLELAREAGCRRVCSAVLPGTASQANLERCGFRVAYPKLELARA